MEFTQKERELIGLSYLSPVLTVEVTVPLPLLDERCGVSGFTCEMCHSKCAQTRQTQPPPIVEFCVPSGPLTLKEEETCSCGEWKEAIHTLCADCHNPDAW